MNQIYIHIAILFTSTAFTFNKMGQCPMALQYYTLKLELKEIKKKINFIMPLLQVTTNREDILAKHRHKL